MKKYEEKDAEIANLIEERAENSKRNTISFKSLANEINSSGLLAQEVLKSNSLTAVNQNLLRDLDSERQDNKKLMARIHQLEKNNNLQLETKKPVAAVPTGKKLKR